MYVGDKLHIKLEPASCFFSWKQLIVRRRYFWRSSCLPFKKRFWSEFREAKHVLQKAHSTFTRFGAKKTRQKTRTKVKMRELTVVRNRDKCKRNDKDRHKWLPEVKFWTKSLEPWQVFYKIKRSACCLIWIA